LGRQKPMLTPDLNSQTLVTVALRAAVAGVFLAAVGAIIYKIFGLSVLAAVLFAISCGVVRAVWRRI
jgi:hypothetical protein